MKIVGAMVVGPLEGERYLKRCLAAMKKQTDEIVVVKNNVDPNTARIIREMGCLSYDDNREWGKAQNKIKETLMLALRQRNPDWVLFLDADEELMMTRKQLEYICSTEHDIAYFFWCLELWDDEDHFREDFTFDTVRLFKFDPTVWQFPAQALHCGNAPEYNAKHATHSQFAFKHYGLMERGERKRRFERYQKYDPEGYYLRQDWYDALLDTQAPLEPVEKWPLETLITYYRKKPVMRRKSQKVIIYRLMNQYGMPYETVKEHVMKEGIQRGHKFLGQVEEEDMIHQSQVEPPPVIAEDNECALCGKVYKTEKGLKAHKTKTHG